MGQNHRLVVYEWRMHSPVWLCACLCVKQRYGLLSPVRARVYMTLWKHSCVCVYAGVCERVNEWVKEKEHTMLVWAGVSPHGLIRHSRQLKNPAYVCVNDWLSSQHHQHTRTSALYHRYTLLVGQARSCRHVCPHACMHVEKRNWKVLAVRSHIYGLKFYQRPHHALWCVVAVRTTIWFYGTGRSGTKHFVH